MKAHAILSPSGAYRWLVCTPSARFEEQIPEEDSIYSREGTLAHEVASLTLAARTGQYKHDQKRFNQELSKVEKLVAEFYAAQDKPNAFQDMIDHAEDYAEYVRGFVPRVGKSEIFIEKRVDMSTFAPLCYGTVDSGVLTPQVLYVTDYKYGAGQRVSAVQNKQMMLYALGLLLLAHAKGYDPDRVVMSIFQPRVSDTASVWELDTADLLDWAEDELAAQAPLAIGGQGDFVAGSHCGFCKAKTSCRAFYDHFEELKDISDKRQMTAKDVEAVLRYGSTVSAWVKQVTDDQRNKMINGARVKGFKLVAGRKVRKFTSEGDAVDVMFGLGFEFENMYKTELRGITDVEGYVGKAKFSKEFAEVVTTVEGQPAIAAADDDRPDIGASAADDYISQDHSQYYDNGRKTESSKESTRRRR